MARLSKQGYRARRVALAAASDASKPADVRYAALMVLYPQDVPQGQERLLPRDDMVRLLLKTIPTLNNPRVELRCIRLLAKLQEETHVIAAAQIKIAAAKELIAAAKLPNPKTADDAATVAVPVRSVERAVALADEHAPGFSDESPLSVLIMAQEGTVVPVAAPAPAAGEGEPPTSLKPVEEPLGAEPVPVKTILPELDEWTPRFAAEMLRCAVPDGFIAEYVAILRRHRHLEAILRRLRGLRDWNEVEDFVKLVQRRLSAPPSPEPKPAPMLVPLVNPTPQQQAAWEVDRLHPFDKNTEMYRDFQSRVYRLMDSPENKRTPRVVLRELAEIHSTTELNMYLNARNCP